MKNKRGPPQQQQAREGNKRLLKGREQAALAALTPHPRHVRARVQVRFRGWSRRPGRCEEGSPTAAHDTYLNRTTPLSNEQKMVHSSNNIKRRGVVGSPAAGFFGLHLLSWWNRPVSGQRSTVVMTEVFSDLAGGPLTR